jgi:curved DNA-binding protein CbpA
MPTRDPYKLLQVDPEADLDVITAVYRALAGRLHPERDITGVDEVRKADLDRAYALLSDPARRAAYDADRSRQAFAIDDGTDHAQPGNGGLTGRIAARSAAEEGGELRIDFGRYAGRSLVEILRADPDYLRWLSRHSSGIRFRGPILRLLAQQESERHPVAGRA